MEVAFLTAMGLGPGGLLGTPAGTIDRPLSGPPVIISFFGVTGGPPGVADDGTLGTVAAIRNVIMIKSGLVLKSNDVLARTFSRFPFHFIKAPKNNKTIAD